MSDEIVPMTDIYDGYQTAIGYNLYGGFIYEDASGRRVKLYSIVDKGKPHGLHFPDVVYVGPVSKYIERVPGAKTLNVKHYH